MLWYIILQTSTAMKLELQHFDSLISLVNHFNSEKRCRDFITEQRWEKMVVCPFCGSVHIYRCSNGDNQFKCGNCHKRFSCLVGTIFQNTKISLQKWFMAIYHYVSMEYLQQYINEAVFRWNTRKSSESRRFAAMFQKALCVCSYEDVKNIIFS